MRTLYLTAVLFCLLVTGALGQSKTKPRKPAQTKPETQSANAETTGYMNEVLRLELLLKAEREALTALRSRYTDEFPKVQEVMKKIAETSEALAEARQKVRDSGYNLPLSPEELPDDSVMLLKLIVLQNERIIQLLNEQKK